MTEQEEVDKSLELISNHLSIPKNELNLSESSFEELENKLNSIVAYLLDKDMSRLLSSLYRIDLDENLFKTILSQEPPENLSRRISKEIIKRELQKVRTRAKYAGQS